MGAYGSLLPTDRQSALGAFLQPMAEGFAGGIEDDRVRRRNISDKVQSYESLIQPQLKFYEGQQQLHQKYNPPSPRVIPKGARGIMLQDGRIMEFPPEQPTSNPNLLSILGRNFEEPRDPNMLPAKPGSENYSASEEAMAGRVPPTKTVPGEHLLMRMLGKDPKEWEVDPSVNKLGEVSAGLTRRPGVVTNQRDAVGEYSRERKVAESEATELGLTGQQWADHVTSRMARYRGAQSESVAEHSVIGRNKPLPQALTVETAGKVGAERAAGGILGELRPVSSPSTPGMMVPGVTAVSEARSRGAIPAQVEKKTAELERTYSLIDQIDTLSKPLITAKSWQEVLPQYVRLKVGSFTNANQAATLYESTLNEFLGQLAREVSQERGVLTNQDIDRIKIGLPSFGNTASVRSGKILLLKNIIRMNQEAENARLQLGGRIPESARMEFRTNIDKMLIGLGQGEGQSVSPQGTMTQNDPMDGKTATGPSGQKLIRRNGAWVPYGK